MLYILTEVCISSRNLLRLRLLSGTNYYDGLANALLLDEFAADRETLFISSESGHNIS